MWLLEHLAQQLRRTLTVPAAQPQPVSLSDDAPVKACAEPTRGNQPLLLSDDPAVKAELRAAGDRLLRQADAQHEESVRAWDKAMAAMGITIEKPIGPEALQQMLIAGGINPEDNEFSRGIIEMREE